MKILFLKTYFSPLHMERIKKASGFTSAQNIFFKTGTDFHFPEFLLGNKRVENPKEQQFLRK